jgi:hypothetical protein
VRGRRDWGRKRELWVVGGARLVVRVTDRGRGSLVLDQALDSAFAFVGRARGSRARAGSARSYSAAALPRAGSQELRDPSQRRDATQDLRSAGGVAFAHGADKLGGGDGRLVLGARILRHVLASEVTREPGRRE